MGKVALMVAVVAVVGVLPATAMWPSVGYYIDYLVGKNCLGEDVALMIEKIGLTIGKQCWMKEWEDTFGAPPASGGRRKRNILKMPSPAPTSLLVCNLKRLNLMTDKYKMNFTYIDNIIRLIRTKLSDAALAEDLLLLSKMCQRKVVAAPIPDAGAIPEASEDLDAMFQGVRAFHLYMDCFNPGSTRVCMRKEMKRVNEMWKEINLP